MFCEDLIVVVVVEMGEVGGVGWEEFLIDEEIVVNLMEVEFVFVVEVVKENVMIWMEEERILDLISF